MQEALAQAAALLLVLRVASILRPDRDSSRVWAGPSALGLGPETKRQTKKPRDIWVWGF